MTTGVAGQPIILYLTFTDLATGLLADPSAIELDITYGGVVDLVPDVAGPFFYSGASSPPGAGQIWRISIGQYACIWAIPTGAQAGAYVANWLPTYGGQIWPAVEDFWVTGGYQPAVPQGDVGYWGGSIAYSPPTSNLAVYAGQQVTFGQVDTNGIAWMLNKVDGWDGCDIQGAGVIPKSGDHGAWPSPQFYAARNLTLTVTATAPSQALRDLARSILQQSVPVSDLALFTYDEPIPKTAMVRRSGRIQETYLDLASVQFTVGLVAPDPRKYGATLHTAGPVFAQAPSAIGFTLPFTLPLTIPAQAPSGQVAVTNAGDFETRPIITVTGPITNPVLTNVNTGQAVSWSGLTVNAGQSLVADFNARQSFVQGAYVPADVSSSWWVLPPGTTTIQLGGAADSGATFQPSWQDAWQ